MTKVSVNIWSLLEGRYHTERVNRKLRGEREILKRRTMCFLLELVSSSGIGFVMGGRRLLHGNYFTRYLFGSLAVIWIAEYAAACQYGVFNGSTRTYFVSCLLNL